MAAIARLAVSLTARTSNFQKGMRRARRQIQGFASTATHAVRRIGAMGAALATLAAGGGLLLLTKRSFESIDAIAKTSDKLGIATEKLTALHHAANLTGVEIGTLEKGLQNMARNVGDAADGTGEAKDALAKLGLDAKALKQLSIDQQFGAIGDAMDKVANQTDRVQIAYDIFGGRATALLNTLRGGSKALAVYEEEARKLGLTFSRIDAAKVEMANDAITRMRAAFTGIGRTIAIQVAPFVQALADRITDAATSGENFGRTLVSWAEAGAFSLAKLADWFEKVKGEALLAKAVLIEKKEEVGALFGILPRFHRRGGPTPMSEYQKTIDAAGEALRNFAIGANQEKVRKFFEDVRRRAQAAAEAIAAARRNTGGMIAPRLEAAAARRQEFKQIERIRFTIPGLQAARNKPQTVVSPQLESILDVLRRMFRQQAEFVGITV